jgi:hypothetical protein
MIVVMEPPYPYLLTAWRNAWVLVFVGGSL